MLTLGFAAQAQSTFSKGTTTANLGLGIGGTLFNDTYSVSPSPTLSRNRPQRGQWSL